MSAASAPSEPTPNPKPTRAGPPAPSPGRFASLLRGIANYGQELYIAVRTRAYTLDFPRLTKPFFGTTDVKLILSRISRAVGLALALENRTLAEAGLGFYAHRPARKPAARKPRAARSDTRPERTDARPARRDAAKRPAELSSAQRLALELRHKSIGEVLADICFELGITPNHPLWPELTQAIEAFGGSTAELEQTTGERWCSTRWLAIPVALPNISEIMAMRSYPWDPGSVADARGPP